MLAAPTFAELATMPAVEADAFVASLSPAELQALRRAWWFWARPEQLWTPGPETWTVTCAGRGNGKTRWAVETCLLWAADPAQTGGHMLFVGATNSDVHATMLYGASGFMTLGRETPGLRLRHYKGRYETIKVQAMNAAGKWRETCAVRFASAEKPDRMRGPETGRIWYDELGAFPLQRAEDNVWAQRTWVNRVPVPGGPKGLVSMTPKPRAEIRELLAECYEPRCPHVDGFTPCGTRAVRLERFEQRTCRKCGRKFWPDVRVITGSIFDNAANVAPETLANVRRLVGTRLYEQEAHGRLVEDVPGALFLQASFLPLQSQLRPRDRHERDTHEQAVRRELGLHLVVVAVDPSGSTSRTACESGVIVVAKRGHGEGATAVVCEDASVRPDEVPAGATMSATYSRAAAAAAWRWGAEAVAIETNNGGDAVIQALEAAVDAFWREQAEAGAEPQAQPRVIAIWAHASKAKRAEFMSIEQTAGRVLYLAMHGEDWRAKWSALVASMTGFSPLGEPAETGKRDRMDAAVHGHRAVFDAKSLGAGWLPVVAA